MTTPCLKRLDVDCFRAHPAWAKRAFAYRLVHLLTPKPLTKRLPKGLRLALVAPGVEIPPGVDIPPGVVVSPGAEVPTGWSPGDPLPEGALPPAIPPPGTAETGITPPTYVAPWEPGPINQPGKQVAPIAHGAATYYPATSQDDGFWYLPNYCRYTRTYICIGNEPGSAYRSWITFDTLPLPQGVEIITATLTLYADDNYSGTPVDVIVYANDEDSPTNPSNATEAEALALTTASVNWSCPDWTQHQPYASPEIKTVIQEILNRSGWTPGNNLMLIIREAGTSSYWRFAHAYNSGLPAYYPALYIEW